MKFRPLGWELTTLFLAVAVLAVAWLFDLGDIAAVVIGLVAVVTPLVLISAGLRLVAGIIEEDRRYRRAKAARTRDTGTRSGRA